MVAPFLTNLQGVLSTDRIERYRPAGGTDLEMLAAYFWNIQLCELLYHPLGALEKALRNTINGVLIAETGQIDWYDKPKFLDKRQAMDVAGAKYDIQAAGKQIVPGRIIAAQNFGFWTSLLSSGYSSVWTAHNQANTIRAFPYAPAHMKYRKPVFEQINAIRLLRNRVFHYESIVDGLTLQNGTQIAITQLHTNIVDAIGWINPTYRNAVQYFNQDFATVYAAGPAGVETRIRAHLGIP